MPSRLIPGLRHGGRVLPLVIALAAAALGPATPAGADGSNVPITDGLNHTYCFVSGFDSPGAADDSMISLDNQTRFTRDFRDCGGGEVDVVFQNYRDDRYLGEYQCLAYGATGRCRHAAVRLNTYVTGNTYRQNRKTLCHEVGHSGGLWHNTGNDDCMISGYVNDDNHKTYNGHHVDHLNGNN